MVRHIILWQLKDELADAGFDYVADEEVDASYDDDADDEF